MNFLDQILAAEWITRLGWTLLHSLWEIALVTAVLALLLSALRRGSANMRYLTACGGLTVMAIVPIVTFGLLPEPQAPAVVASATTEEATPIEIAAVEMGIEITGVPVSGHPGEHTPLTSPPATVVASAAPQPTTEVPATDTSEESSLQQIAAIISPWTPWCVVAWFVGVFVVSMWNLGGWIAAQRLKRLGTNPVAEDISRRLSTLAERSGISRSVAIMKSLMVEVPVVVGWLRPMILLPAGILTGLTPAELDAILAHELAHIRRHDYLVNLLQTVIETLLFYHPGVWWLSRQIRAEREHCCDDVAVAVCGNKADYASALAAVEAGRAAPKMVMAARKAGSSTLGRIRRVLGLAGNAPSRWGRSLAGGLITSAMIVALVTCFVVAGERTSENASKTETASAESVGDADRIAQLIEQLGDDTFSRREAAQRELIRIGRPALAALQAARGHADAEIAARAKRCLAKIDPPNLNGVYSIRGINSTEPGVEVSRSDADGTLVLLHRLTDNFGTATMASIANDNSRFRINLKAAGPFAEHPGISHFALWIDGLCVMVGAHSNLDKDRRMNLTAWLWLDGKEVPARIAAKLGITPALRKHPGHKMTATFSPAKRAFGPGEPVVLNMEIKNVGGESFSFGDGGRQRGARNNQFGFTAFRRGGDGPEVPDTGDPMHWGGKGSFITLKPGEVFQKQIDIAKWFDLAKPDTYKINCRFEMEISGNWDDVAQGTAMVVVADQEATYAEASWCKPVDGLRTRLRPTQRQWKSGTTPTLALDLWNDSDQDKQFLYVGVQAAECEIEVDGQWYRWADICVVRQAVLSLKAGQARDDAVKISLTRSWARTDEAMYGRPVDDALRLNLTPGKHALRVAFTPDGPVPREKRPRIVSLPIEIEIVSKSDDTTTANPLGLDDDTLVKIYRAGSVLQRIAFDCESYYQDRDRLPKDVPEQATRYQERSRASFGIDLFAPGERLRLILDKDDSRRVQVWSVGPDGDWDGGRQIDSTKRSLDGDLGIEIRVGNSDWHWLADEGMKRHLKGERLAHYLAAKGPKLPRAERKDDGLKWGPVVDGLQAAVELSPKKNAYLLGESIDVQFHIRNAADYAIQVGLMSGRWQDGSVFIHDAAGKRLKGQGVWMSGTVGIIQHTLKPGETVSRPTASLAFVAPGKRPSASSVGHWVEAAPGVYTVQLAQRFPMGFRGQPREWRGVLETASVTVRIAEQPKFAADGVGEPAWGKALEGVKSQLQPVEFRDGYQWMSFDLRNDSSKLSVQLGPNGRPEEIIIGDLVYVWGGRVAGSMPVCKPGMQNRCQFKLDENWIPMKMISGSGMLKLKPGKHTVQAAVYATGKDDNNRDRKVRVLSNAIEIEIAADPKTKNIGKKNTAWGKPLDGLRCRWIPSAMPVRVGTKPMISMEVENTSNKPILWNCASEITLGLSKSAPPSGYAMPKFSLRLGQHARLATAGEVREQFGIGWPDRKDADPAPDYYRLEPTGRVVLTAECPWEVDKVGPAKIYGIVFRVHPITDNVYPAEKTEVRCPPLILSVVGVATAAPWGPKGTDGLQIRLVIPEALGEAAAALTDQRYFKAPVGLMTPQVRLEVKNAGEKTIKLATGNVNGGRKNLLDEWLLGLSLEMRDGDAVRRLTRTDDQGDFWSAIGTMPSTREIKPGETVEFALRLNRLADERGRPLSSLHGPCRLRPVLEIRDGRFGLWHGTARGEFVPVVIGGKGAAAFQPVIVRAVSFDFFQDEAYLDLDTGRFGKEQPGMDIIAAMGESDMRVRAGLNMVVIAVDASRWDSTPKEVLDAVAGAKPVRQARLGGSESRQTFFFKTREGGVGVLRITPVAGIRGEVTVRYKMLPRPKDAGPWSKPVDGLRWRIGLPSDRIEAGKPIVVNMEFQNVSDKPLRIFKKPTVGENLYPMLYTSDGERDMYSIEHNPDRNVQPEDTVLIEPGDTYRTLWIKMSAKQAGPAKIMVSYYSPKNTNPEITQFWSGQHPQQECKFTVVPPATDLPSPNEKNENAARIELKLGSDKTKTISVTLGQSAVDIQNLCRPAQVYADDDPWLAAMAAGGGSYVFFFAAEGTPEEMRGRLDARRDKLYAVLRYPTESKDNGTFLLPGTKQDKTYGDFVTMNVSLGLKKAKAATVALGMSTEEVKQLFSSATDHANEDHAVVFDSVYDDNKYLLLFTSEGDGKTHDPKLDKLSEVIYRHGDKPEAIYLLPRNKRGKPVAAEHRELLGIDGGKSDTGTSSSAEKSSGTTADHSSESELVKEVTEKNTEQTVRERIAKGFPRMARPMDSDARQRFLEIERIARLPMDEQAKELPRLYKDLAPRYMNMLVEGLISSYRANILDNTKFDGPGGDHTTRWAQQLADAASEMTPEEVVGKLGHGLWQNTASRARAIQVFKKHADATAALISADLKAEKQEAAERAAQTIQSVGLLGFSDALLDALLRDDETSEPARRALIFMRGAPVKQRLLEEVKKDPQSLIRFAGLFQSPLHRKPAEPMLLELLNSPDAEIRYAAVYAVYECSDPKLAQFTVRFAVDKDKRFRVGAAQFALNLPKSSFLAVREQLLPLLADEDEEVRKVALKAFVQQKDLAAAEVILKLLKQDALSEGFKATVMQGMVTLAGNRFHYFSHEWGPDRPGNQKAIDQFEAWLKDARANREQSAWDGAVDGVQVAMRAKKSNEGKTDSTKRTAAPTKTTVRGKVVDDATGKTVADFFTEGGRFDPADPAKVVWGYSETRSDRKDGQFSATVRWSEGWTARIVAAGYLPQPLLTEPPSPGQDVIDVVIRLKRGDAIRGRVLDHTGKPVAKAGVYLAGRGVIGLAEGPWDELQGPSVHTDAEGRFEIGGRGEDSKAIFVTAPSLYVWRADLPEPGQEATIRLPEPAKLHIRYDIEGGPPAAQVRIELRTWDMPKWKALVDVVRWLDVKPGEDGLVVDNLPPGVYDISRIKHTKAGNSGKDMILDRQLELTLASGKMTAYDFVRKAGMPISGEVVGLPKEGVDGVFLYVRDQRASGNPRNSDDWKLPTFDGLALEGNGSFQTERIPPGKYKVVVEAYKQETPGEMSHSGWRLPKWTAAADVDVSKSGEPPKAHLIMRPYDAH